jgi:hypothetical protein
MRVDEPWDNPPTREVQLARCAPQPDTCSIADVGDPIPFDDDCRVLPWAGGGPVNHGRPRQCNDVGALDQLNLRLTFLRGCAQERHQECRQQE